MPKIFKGNKKTEYGTVAVPTDLMMRVKKIVSSEGSGFLSMQDFVRESLRRNCIYYEEKKAEAEAEKEGEKSQ